MKDRVILKGLVSADYASPADQAAIRALEKVPLLPKAVKVFNEHGLDRWLYVYNMGRSVRCGPRQMPSLYKMLREACEVLDVAEPELYVGYHPFVNAFAGGVERPYIVLRSSMIDALTDDELLYVIGHELGHIKSNHVLYFMVGTLVKPLLELIGRRTLGIGDAASFGLLMALYEWQRWAEVTADRAGLLCVQDLNTVLSAQMKLCAGPNRFSDEFSLEAFKDQARTYQNVETKDAVGKMLWFILANWQTSHPMWIHRAQQIEKWYEQGAYSSIIKQKSLLESSL